MEREFEDSTTGPVSIDELQSQPASELADVPQAVSGRRPGPGLPESLCWLFLFFVLQIGGMLVVLAVALALTLHGLDELQGFNFTLWLDSLDASSQMAIAGTPSLLCYFVLIPLGLWRMSPRPLKTLKLNLPSWKQTLLACSLVMPLTVVADALMQSMELPWRRLVNEFPGLAGLNEMDVHQVLGNLGGASLPLTVFLIAVVPAVGEEFLFRGLIGRGLTSRWGMIAGIGITSFLFAAVHLYPPHVIGILPVGIALHVIYLTTRSFWAPVLFHFLNNALATVLMRIDLGNAETPWYVLPIALGYTIWSLYWLYRMRTVDGGTDLRASTGLTESPTIGDANPKTFESDQFGQQSQPVSEGYLLPCVMAVLMLGFCLFDLIRVLVPNLADLT